MQSESAKGYGIQNDQHCQKTCAYHGQNNLPSFDLAPILFNFENTFLGIFIVSEASPQHRGEVPGLRSHHLLPARHRLDHPYPLQPLKLELMMSLPKIKAMHA